MSECDRVQSLLSASVDGELSVHELHEVEKHLPSCAACREERETLTDLDDRLSKIIVVDGVNQKCSDILRAANSTQLRNTQQQPSWYVVIVAIAIAATLLLALLPSFFRAQTSQVAIPQPAFVAQLVRATGPVRFLSPGATAWTELVPNALDSLAAGSRLRTDAGVLCEVQTQNKGLIRLNESAEIVLNEPNQVELIAGQLWCLSPELISIDVVIPEVKTQKPLLLAFACPSSTELQCVAGESFASCTSVSPDNSVATITMGSTACSVAPGETVSIDGEQNIDRQLNVDLTKKIWQLPLLAIGTEVDKELVSLLDRLLAPIGMSKVTSMNESQIRKLGPAGAIPLLAYVAAETSPEHLQLRRTAVRLASELADERSVRLLKLLTSDQDEYISRVSAETLNRVVPKSL